MCVFPIGHHSGALGCPLPPPRQYSLDLTECRSAIWAGWLGRQTPAAFPAAVPSWGEAWAARRVGLREEVIASVLFPQLGGGTKAEVPGLRRTNKGSQLCHAPEGTKALALPQSHVGADILEPVNPMPGVRGWRGTYPEPPSDIPNQGVGVHCGN